MDTKQAQTALDALTGKWLNGGAVSDVELLVIMSKSGPSAQNLRTLDTQLAHLRAQLAAVEAERDGLRGYLSAIAHGSQCGDSCENERIARRGLAHAAALAPDPAE
jgi:hypothetical protein